MCFSSQHGIPDTDILHKRYLEFARSGAVSHGEEDREAVRSVEVSSSGAGFQ